MLSLQEKEDKLYFIIDSGGCTSDFSAIEHSDDLYEVIATDDLYGGSYRLFTTVFAQFGIVFHFVSMQDTKSVESKLNAKTKLIWVETPTNPMLNIIDIEAMAICAKKVNAFLVVDNTFATPYLQNPLELGADIVMHSATKYLGGHSDVIMGALICNNEKIAEEIVEEIRSTPFLWQEKAHKMTASIGVFSTTPSEKTSLHDYITRADAAMYTAKHSGRDQVSTYLNHLS